MYYHITFFKKKCWVTLVLSLEICICIKSFNFFIGISRNSKFWHFRKAFFVRCRNSSGAEWKWAVRGGIMIWLYPSTRCRRVTSAWPWWNSKMACGEIALKRCNVYDVITAETDMCTGEIRIVLDSMLNKCSITVNWLHPGLASCFACKQHISSTVICHADNFI